MRTPKGFIQRAGLQKLCLRPRSFNASVIYHDNLVGIHDGGEPVGNDDERLASHEPRNALLNDGFSPRSV